MNKENIDVDNDVIFDDFGDLSELDFGGKSEEEVKEQNEIKTEYIKENLWYKLEKVGKKISFAKDVIALYRYMTSSLVSWHRKAIDLLYLADRYDPGYCTFNWLPRRSWCNYRFAEISWERAHTFL